VLVAVAALVITTTSAATEMQVIRTYNARGVVISLILPENSWFANVCLFAD